jgi:type VI secretion system protein ImpM
MSFAPTATGFFGKLPARGDFVRVGLPEDFVETWDEWCRGMLLASRTALGDDWDSAWMQAPIWRFLVPPGACGKLAVLGVWLPSVDKVGRHFPFAICALAPSLADLAGGAAWLDTAEAVALSGVVEDAPHDGFLAAITPGGTTGDSRVRGDDDDQATPLTPGWWTDGSPYVRAQRLDILTLPPSFFAGAMLRDAAVIEAL